MLLLLLLLLRRPSPGRRPWPSQAGGCGRRRCCRKPLEALRGALECVQLRLPLLLPLLLLLPPRAMDAVFPWVAAAAAAQGFGHAQPVIRIELILIYVLCILIHPGLIAVVPFLLLLLLLVSRATAAGSLPGPSGPHHRARRQGRRLQRRKPQHLLLLS